MPLSSHLPHKTPRLSCPSYTLSIFSHSQAGPDDAFVLTPPEEDAHPTLPTSIPYPPPESPVSDEDAGVGRAGSLGAPPLPLPRYDHRL